jgi:4-amino-4-deoxy-L-arabinose transferase-like glycosyltransferase
MPALRTRHWLIAIVVAGAVLRIFAIWFGLPYLFARPDEEAATGIAAQIRRGYLNPHFFHWPSLTFYLFAVVFWLYRAVLRLFTAHTVSTAEYFVIGRAVVAAAGTFTLILIFKIGRRVGGEVIGLIAAALLAVSILHVRDSHFAMTDVLATCFVTASLALLLRAIDERAHYSAVQWFAAAGLVGGLAASTKYNAGAVAAAMVAGQVLLVARERHLRALLPSVVYGALFFIGFLIATPYAVLDFPKFKEDLLFDFTHLSGGHGVNLGRGWGYHLKRSLPYGLGPVTFVAMIVGLVPFVRHHTRHAVVLGAFVVLLYASIGSGYTVFFRYILPVVPIACVVAAVGIRATATWLGARVALPLLLSVTVGIGLVNCIWFDVVLARTDSRVLAGDWLRPRLTPSDTLHDAGGDYTALDLAQVRFHQWFFDPATNSFGAPDGETPDWLVLYESPLYTYARVPSQLQTLARTRYELVHTVRATTGRRSDAVYDLQDAFFVPMWGLWSAERPGPTVLIYKRQSR